MPDISSIIAAAMSGVKPSYAQLKSAIAEAANVDTRAVNPKLITGHNMVMPRASESRNNRSKKMDMPEWIFVGLVNTDGDVENVLRSLRNEIRTFATVAPIFVSDGEQWTLREINYETTHAAVAGSLQNALGADPAIMIPFHASQTSAPASTVATLPPAIHGLEEEDLFVSEDRRREIADNLLRKKALILSGPPGTGKTILMDQLAWELADGDTDRIGSVQFHPDYGYSTFMRGWWPKGDGFDLVDGVFLTFCEKARSQEGRFVFKIDEISRAHTSGVFGEAMSLIEPDKRNNRFAVRLLHPRSEDEAFFIPENVHVIGTTNTADRSLSNLDSALRRRFAFEAVDPAFESDAFTDFLQRRGVEDRIIDRIVTRMAALNERIRLDTKNLGPGYEVGHSYFCPRESGTYGESWYNNVIRTEIAPLLRDYWIEDQSTIDRVLEELLNP